MRLRADVHRTLTAEPNPARERRRIDPIIIEQSEDFGVTLWPTMSACTMKTPNGFTV
jgi:hypothetical protein